MNAVDIRAGVKVNLDALRTQLAERIALLLLGASAFAAWLCIPQQPFPALPFVSLVLLIALMYAVWRLLHTNSAMGRYSLVIGLNLFFLAGLVVYDIPWLPFAGMLLTFSAAMLVRYAEFPTAALTIVATCILGLGLDRPYPLAGFAILIGFSTIFARLVIGTVYMALEWESMARQNSDHLLSEIRTHRAQLSETVKSLNLAYELQSRTQAELIRAKKFAEEARRLKERFAANISHELRTPLNLIFGFSQVMYQTPEVYGDIAWPNKLRRDISQIYRNSSHLLDMIDDVLDLSRVESAAFALNVEPTPLQPLLEEVAGIAQDMFQNSAVEFRLDLAPTLPTLDIDRTRVRQVLLNLLNNARRFTETGYVSLSARVATTEVIITVKDTGIGITPEQHRHIFEEFYQADSSLRRRGNGAGLGLTISKKFVEAHEGRIWVESQPGNGATFFVSLPTHSYFGRFKEPISADTGSRLPLLVLDADPITLQQLQHSLGTFEVIAMISYEKLIASLQQYYPCVILWNQLSQGLLTQDVIAQTGVAIIACSLPTRALSMDWPSHVHRLSKPVEVENLTQLLRDYPNARRVLLVDEDAGFVQLLERMIESTMVTCVVEHAYDGESALELIHENTPDLLLLNPMMADLTGFQLLDAIGGDERLKTIPIILLGAEAVGDAAGARHAGHFTVHCPPGLYTKDMLRLIHTVATELL